MSVKAPRHPVQAKSLTLLELCQTIQDLRRTSSQDASQILTRRLYFHPINTKSNSKQRQSSKLVARGILQTTPSQKQTSHPNLSILSSSFSFATRSNSKMNSSIMTDNDDTNELEISTVTSSFNQISLAPITQRPPLLTKRRTALNRSLYIPDRQLVQLTDKIDTQRLNLWNYINKKFDRPCPQDPPTTPLHNSTDFDIQQQESYYSFPDIINYK
ncbi:hypothetical protein I4U23_012396 [Adineta vaga]|nr:hypothetical protein I4U23_012396 [Adineta vaga]